MKKIPLYLSAAILLFVPFFAEAKNLYVSPSGNDSVTYANNSVSTPWRSIGRAAWGSVTRSSPNTSQAAQAGDVVLVASGTYGEGTATGSSGINPLYNPANNGTSGNPILFQCEVAGGCVLTSSNYEGPLVGTYDRDYITWDGFYINESNTNQAADSGIAIIRDSDYVTLKRLTLVGGVGNWGGTNHNGIRIEFSTNCRVNNTEVSGVSGDNGANDTGLTLYVSNGCIIENNYFHNNEGAQLIEKTGVNSGVTWTHDNVFRYNIFANGGAGIFISGGGENSTYYQNIISGNENGITLSPLANTTGTLTNYKFVNNSFINNGYGVYSGGANRNGTASFLNNIFSGGTHVFMDEGSSSGPNNYTFEHNNYYGSTHFAQVVYINQTFNTWKSNYGKDSASPASIATNPSFVSSSNFNLSASSPALNIGVDVLDLNSNSSVSDVIPAGAYITGNEVIGLNLSGSAPVTPPSDTTSPSVSVTSPTTGSTVSGSSVSVTASASDNTGVVGVQFLLNGSTLNSEDTSSPYTTTLNTTSLTNGTHTLTARARDAAGNTTISSSVSITVNNTVATPAPTVDIQINNSNLAASITSGAIVTVSWTSTNATSCTVTPSSWTGTSGSQSILPTLTTTYTVTCNGAGGSATDSIGVTVNAVTVPTTPPSTGGGGGSAPTTPTQPTTPSTGSGSGSSGGTPSTPTQPTPSTPTVPKPTITRSLYVGVKGSDVTELQTYLITTGYLTSGLNTGYYGEQTKLAVQKYQCSTLQLCSGTQTSNGYGVVGVKTRAALTSTTAPTTTPTNSTLTEAQRAVMQKQISDLLLLVAQLMEQLKKVQGN